MPHQKNASDSSIFVLYQIWCISIACSVQLYNFIKSVTSPGVIRFTKKKDTVLLYEGVPIRGIFFVKLL